MTDLNQALLDIRSIRRLVAQTTEFRGYGPLTLSATALVALLAGVLQAYLLPRPLAHPAHYVALWLSVGVFCAALIATQMLTRASRLHSGMADEMIRLAVLQFLPAAIVGAVLPLLLLRVQPAVLWMMPGLWQLLFGVGSFACCRSLPRPMLLVGVWFLFTGFACLLPGDERALAPLAMALPYTVGMSVVAAIHHFSAQKAGHDEIQ